MIKDERVMVTPEPVKNIGLVKSPDEEVNRDGDSERLDLFREPYREYCSECQEWVIALDGHCINDDSHRTSTFTPEERKTLFVKRNWEDGPEVIF